MANLQDLEEQATTVLFRCRTVFPFTLFPTTIEVTSTRIDISYGLFFFSKEKVSVLIQDLANIMVISDLLFASVIFQTKILKENPEQVKFLWNHAGLELKQIVLGLMEAKQANMDIPTLNAHQKKTIQHIGTSPSDEPQAI